MRVFEILSAFVVLLIVALAILWGWPARQERARVRSGLRAAELGAKLAFAENVHREKFGAYTQNFTRLSAVLGEELPCPLAEEGTELACASYRYRVTGNILTVWQAADPSVYFTFGLSSGQVDCSHAPADVQSAPLCSALE